MKDHMDGRSRDPAGCQVQLNAEGSKRNCAAEQPIRYCTVAIELCALHCDSSVRSAGLKHTLTRAKRVSVQSRVIPMLANFRARSVPARTIVWSGHEHQGAPYRVE